MRLDKYLKVSRLIKRRTVANEACDAGRVLINDRPAKASAQVKEGDVLEIQFGSKAVRVEVLNVQEAVKKEEAQELVICRAKRSVRHKPFERAQRNSEGNNMRSRIPSYNVSVHCMEGFLYGRKERSNAQPPSGKERAWIDHRGH